MVYVIIGIRTREEALPKLHIMLILIHCSFLLMTSWIAVYSVSCMHEFTNLCLFAPMCANLL